MYNSGIETVFIKARAKINLNLQILEKREDNYHNLESVFQKINLYDELFVSKCEQEGLIIDTNIKELESKENIIYKAYIKLKEKYSQIKGVTVKLNKKIPMQAGLAGGSTDCAAFILAINKLYKLNMTKKEIEELGVSLGADVVPCLYNTAIKANGIGEKITKINTDFLYYILIIKPNFSCNTKEMFEKIDTANTVGAPFAGIHCRGDHCSSAHCVQNTENIIKALETNNINLLTNNLYNTFEDAVPEDIHKIKEELIDNGAIGALMTGSGSCVFGIYENRDNIKKAYNNLKDKYEVYLTTSYNSYREM